MRTLHLLSLLCTLTLTVLAKPRHKTVNLYLSEQTVWADGNPSARAYVINGSFPAPTLRFEVGDVVTVNVTNSLSHHNTTVHWHGLSQRNTPWCDGVPAVTQWAIAPGRWFACTFKLEETANTFYHSHVGLQAMTAHGAFIVDEADGQPTFDYEDDRVLEAGDYWHQSIDAINHGLLNETFKWPGSANALLLNGKAPLVSCNETLAQAQNVSCSEAPADAGLPEVVKIGYKQKLRLRYIGTGSLMHQKIGIFNHTQALIDVDGTYIDPIEVTDVEIMPGQRYSTRIVGKSKKEVKQDGSGGCYWIRQESRWRNPSANSWALLAYPSCDVKRLLAKKPLATPIPVGFNTTLLPEAKFGWITAQMKPLFNNAENKVPDDAEVTRRVIINTQQIPAGPSGKASRWANNAKVYSEEGSSFERPSTDVPYLIQLYTKQANAPSYVRALNTNGYDNQTSAFVAKAGEVIDIVIINNGSQTGKQVEIHPWHNHGIKMHTLASGPGNFSDEALKAARATGYQTPIPRDTHIVYPTPAETTSNPKGLLPDNSSGGWTMLRHKITEKDAGVWLLHCHVHFHAIMGMNTVWSQDSDRTMNAMAVSSLSNDSSYLTFGNNVNIPLPQ